MFNFEQVSAGWVAKCGETNHEITVLPCYREIPLTHPERIYGQRTNLMGQYSRGKGGAYIREEKHLNLQPVKLTFPFFFSSIKQVFSNLSCRARCDICSKLTIKTPEYVKLTIKFKIKAPLTSF